MGGGGEEDLQEHLKGSSKIVIQVRNRKRIIVEGGRKIGGKTVGSGARLAGGGRMVVEGSRLCSISRSKNSRKSFLQVLEEEELPDVDYSELVNGLDRDGTSR